MLKREDLAGSALVWLLEVDLGGRVFRFSSSVIDVVKDGVETNYAGGLDAEKIDYRQSVDRLGVSAEQTASIEVVFPIDLPLARRRGHRLSAARAELSLMPSRHGVALQSWAGRHVVAVGLCTQPQIGDPEKPSGWASFTIDAGGSEDHGRLIPPKQRIDDWTLLDSWTTNNDQVEASIGKTMPIIIGNPGRYTDPQSGPNRVCEGSPAYVVDYHIPADPPVLLSRYWYARTLLIAAHHVSATSVTVFAENADTPVFLAVTNTADKLGRPIAVIDLTVAGTPITSGTAFDSDFKKSGQFWVAWGRTGLSITGGGMANPFKAGAELRAAGDVIRWALRKSTIAVDDAAWASAAPVLNALMPAIDCYINDPDATPWEWVQENLLPLLPVSVRQGEHGLYPIVHDIGRRKASTMPSLEQGRELIRIGPLQSEADPANIYRQIALEYAPRAKSDSAYQRIAVIGDSSISTGERATIHSREAAASYPDQGVRTLSTVVLYSDRSAGSAARRLLREGSRVPLTVTYAADQSAGWLPVAGQFRLTDSDLYFTDQVAEVLTLAWDGSMWTIEVLIFEDPARDDRG